MTYKVEFSNNLPIKAIHVDEQAATIDVLQFEENTHQALLKYMRVIAESEREALERAARMFRHIWGEMTNTPGY